MLPSGSVKHRAFERFHTAKVDLSNSEFPEFTFIRYMSILTSRGTEIPPTAEMSIEAVRKKEIPVVQSLSCTTH